jgi:hypothetical protein
VINLLFLAEDLEQCGGIIVKTRKLVIKEILAAKTWYCFFKWMALFLEETRWACPRFVPRRTLGPSAGRLSIPTSLHFTGARRASVVDPD